MTRVSNSEIVSVVLAEAELHSTWQGFVDFGRLQLRDLRKPALKTLNTFLDTATFWPFADRQTFVEWFLPWCESDNETERVLQPFPLLHRLIEPTLIEWWKREPENGILYRWFAAFTQGQRFTTSYGRVIYISPLDCLRYAVYLAPQDQNSLYRLASLLSYGIYLDQHHLPDYYINTPYKTLESADELEQVAAGISDVGVRISLQESVDQGRQKARDWFAFQASGESDFEAWCDAHGRPYHWTPAFYYELRHKSPA